HDQPAAPLRALVEPRTKNLLRVLARSHRIGTNILEPMYRQRGSGRDRAPQSVRTADAFRRCPTSARPRPVAAAASRRPRRRLGGTAPGSRGPPRGRGPGGGDGTGGPAAAAGGAARGRRSDAPDRPRVPDGGALALRRSARSPSVARRRGPCV